MFAWQQTLAEETLILWIPTYPMTLNMALHWFCDYDDIRNALRIELDKTSLPVQFKRLDGLVVSCHSLIELLSCLRDGLGGDLMDPYSWIQHDRLSGGGL